MLRLKLKLLFIIAPIFIGGVYVNEACAEAKTEQEQFVQQIGDSVSALIAPDKELSPQQREDGFRQILQQNFNLPSISKFVLAKYRNGATEEQISEFTHLFEEIIVETFSDQFKDYSGATLEVTGSKTGNDGATVVSSKVLGPKPLQVDWLVREKNGKPLVYDVIVAGVSTGVTKRSEYGSISAQTGNGIQGLNQALREKINKNKS